MKLIAIICLIGTVISAVSYVITSYDSLLTVAIVFGTIAYHLLVRLLISFVFNKLMKNKANLNNSWYKVGKLEMSFYKKLKVKKWKDKMPTYEGELFDPKKHTWDEIAQAMCQAELIHETNVILSFLPVLAGIWFGSYSVFIITSICAAIFDMIFVVIQRYNRQRIMNIISHFACRQP